MHRWLGDIVTATFVAFTTYSLSIATRGEAVALAAVGGAAATPGFWIRGTAGSGWVLLGILSLRFLHTKTVREHADALWRWGILGWGGFMWVAFAISMAADHCGGLTLRVFLCRDFAVETLLGLVSGFPIWPWGGYMFGALLFGFLGHRSN